MGIKIKDAMLTIDIRKGRLRVFKAVLHKLGDPKNIQLLINPKARVIAIRGADGLESTHNTLSVARFLAPGGRDIDLYCYYLIRDMQVAFPELSDKLSYHLHGVFQAKENMMCFPLSTLSEVKGEQVVEDDNG